MLVSLWGLFFFYNYALAIVEPQKGRVTPTVGMVPTPDRLQRPTLPANPNQADLGSQVYYYVCMACHGDQGQGLSEEWIAAWELGEESCWQSRCHASNHPEDGFELPRVIPAVVGPHIPARFATALELHDYLRAAMPWHAPGSLKEDEYWQVTAFLLRMNGFDPGSKVLDESNAADFRLRPSRTTPSLAATQPASQPVPDLKIPPSDATFPGMALSALVLLTGLLIWGFWMYNKRRR